VDVEAAWGWGGGKGGRGCSGGCLFGEEGGVFLLFVVYDECAIVVGGEEEVLGAWEPLYGGYWGWVDDALILSA